LKSYKILALTDHSGHSKENSIYALLSKMAAHPQCAAIDVASRGSAINTPFFYENKGSEIWVHQADTSFDFDATGLQFEEGLVPMDVLAYDAIFMRLPRPLGADFLEYIAELAKDKVIFNHPLGMEKTGNKAFLTNFPEVCPPIRLVHSIEAIMDFAKQFPIVLKPLKDYGGKGLLRLEGDRINDGEIWHSASEYLQRIENFIQKEGYLAMKYLKNVGQGDKRILVVNGEIMAASLRIPAEGSWLCNVAQGGRSITTKVTDRERAIIKTITPTLLEAGILMFGADTLVNDDGQRVLSEINTLSIGGFPQAEAQTGQPVIHNTINKIMSFITNEYRK